MQDNWWNCFSSWTLPLFNIFHISKCDFYANKWSCHGWTPLFSIRASLYMEYFEELALNSFPLKPRWWKHYIDDTNVCWPHAYERLEPFHSHLSNLVDCIQLTNEFESNQQLPFLDVLIIRKNDGTLAHQVFRKTTHMNLYLHALSRHYPTQKMEVLNLLQYQPIIFVMKCNVPDIIK